MTAVNLTFNRNQALVVTDLLRVGGEGPAMVTKAHVLPSMRLIFAGSGRTLILQEALFALMIKQSGADDVEAVNEWMPAQLRRIWAEWSASAEEHATTIYLVGWTHVDGIAAFRYRSPSWESERVEPGVCYCAPGVEDDPPPVDEASDSNVENPVLVKAGDVWVPTWADRVRIVLSYFRRQHRKFPETVGERLQVTHLTATSARQWFPRPTSMLHDIEREVAAS